MNDPLSIYLQDHLAGAAHAIDLLEYMREQHSGDDLRDFASMLLLEIKADRELLLNLAERVGDGSSTLKKLAAQMSEKVARLKLSHHAGDGLGLLESLEFLALGIQGKLALWRALEAAARRDRRLLAMDFRQLAMRAERQHAIVEDRRLQVAYLILGVDQPPGRSRREEPRRPPGPRGIGIAGTLVAAAVVALAFSLAPDLARYMKIRAM
jgi:hypothetical protein